MFTEYQNLFDTVKSSLFFVNKNTVISQAQNIKCKELSMH